MDSMRVSEAPDTGSIPVEATNKIQGRTISLQIVFHAVTALLMRLIHRASIRIL